MSKIETHQGWKRIRAGAVWTSFLFLIWSGLAFALSDQTSSPSVEDHRALAARYRQEAAQEREAIKQHEISIRMYSKWTEEPYRILNPQGRERMLRHCQRLVEYRTKTAEELEAMAAEHAAMAESSPDAATPP